MQNSENQSCEMMRSELSRPIHVSRSEEQIAYDVLKEVTELLKDSGLGEDDS